MIDVSRDYAGLRIAVREYFEDAHAWRKVEKTLRARGEQIANREDYVRKSLPQLSFAAGYYLWVSYLVWLDRVHEIAGFRDLEADEAEGIAIVRAARNEWLGRHPRCFKCGALNEKNAMVCEECGVRFNE